MSGIYREGRGSQSVRAQSYYFRDGKEKSLRAGRTDLRGEGEDHLEEGGGSPRCTKEEHDFLVGRITSSRVFRKELGSLELKGGNWSDSKVLRAWK